MSEAAGNEKKPNEASDSEESFWSAAGGDFDDSVAEEHGILLFLSRIMDVPKEGRETFYRRLLELNFLVTSDAAFAVDKDKDAVYLRALRRLSGLDFEEFEDLLHTMATVADEWDDRLTEMFPDD